MKLVLELSLLTAKQSENQVSAKSLWEILRFAEAFPDLEIVSSLLGQLSWTHFLAIIYLKDPLQREFYAEMCRVER